MLINYEWIYSENMRNQLYIQEIELFIYWSYPTIKPERQQWDYLID